MTLSAKRKIHFFVPLLVVILLLAKQVFSELDIVKLGPGASDFLTLSLSVLLEATPFVILGVVLSVFIRFYLPENVLIRFLPKNNLLRRLLLSVLGVGMPVCECGNLPLARGLMLKELRPSEAITFLLAAPILNPVTITTTVLAFGGDPVIVIARLVSAFLIANFVGYVLSKAHAEKGMLSNEFKAYCEHEDGHTHDSKSRLTQLLHSFRHEMNTLMPVLVLGSIIAGLSQVVIPRSFLTGLGAEFVLSIAIMILLAFIVSICSSVDAFFALAYARDFTPGSIVAFLVFGPMIDIKMLTLMRTTFTKKVLIEMTLLVTLCSMLAGLVVNYAF
jgi:hypothetical protein